jgi:hypothetical protein
MLDEIYLVIPSCEYEHGLANSIVHVKSSYGPRFKEIGVGLIASEDEKLNFEIPFSVFPRSAKPDLKKNEAWLKQKFWNCFEDEFDVEGEGKLLKPEPEIPKKKAANAEQFLQKIDLFLLPKGYSITEVAYNQDMLDCIGIEVKYGIENKQNLKRQLNRYVDSKCLTKLYLVIGKEDIWIKEEIERSDIKCGIFLCDGREVKTILEAPKLQMQYDMFAYMPPMGNRVVIYEFGKPRSIKTIEPPPYSTNERKFFREWS